MSRPGESVPLPQVDRSVVAVAPPGDGPGYWAGAPSAVLADGVTYLAYRLRRPIGEGRGFANVIARSEDGERFHTLAVLERERFGAESLERPTLVQLPAGGWRLYVSSDLPDAGGWRVEAMDAADPAGFDPSERHLLLPGSEARSVKDPVVAWSAGRWHMWICCHPTGEPETDQAYTAYATSDNGLEWSWHGLALTGRPGSWDERLARITSVLLRDGTPLAYYDGRATAAENYEERTGIAAGSAPGSFQPTGDGPRAVSPYGSGSLRYLSVVQLPDGGHRLYYEASREDGAHDLHAEYVAAT